MKKMENTFAVTGFFDYIEDLIERENTFNMSQFSESVSVSGIPVLRRPLLRTEVNGL